MNNNDNKSEIDRVTSRYQHFGTGGNDHQEIPAQGDSLRNLREKRTLMITLSCFDI
jgi:hypothetical protein